MKYIIPSISNTRDRYKNSIRERLSDWDELNVSTVNGNVRSELDLSQKEYSYKLSYPALVGQLGRWYTFLNHAKLSQQLKEPIFVIEDDAIVANDFNDRVGTVLNQVPEDADFFSLFIPRNKDHSRVTIVKNFGKVKIHFPAPDWDIGKEDVTRAYQPYGGVAMVLYPSLYSKIGNLLIDTGINMQFDDYLYRMSQEGRVNGYTVFPNYQDLVWISGNEPSTVHTTEVYS